MIWFLPVLDDGDDHGHNVNVLPDVFWRILAVGENLSRLRVVPLVVVVLFVGATRSVVLCSPV